MWEVKPDGSHLRQLFASWSSDHPHVCCGNWSRDGKYFIFQSTREGTANLWAMREKGDLWRKVSNEPVRLTVGEMSAQAPLPNKDGTKVFFIGATRRNEQTRQVTALPDSVGLFSPRWSPDGRYLLAMTGDYQKLVLYDFSTRKWEDLLKMPSAYPSWSKNAKCVYFNNPWSKALPECRICLNDRKVEHIVDLSRAGNIAQATFGWWTGLGPDDSILSQRDISVEEIYALDIKLP